LLPDQLPDHGCEFFQVRLGLGTSLKYLGKLDEARQLLSETLALLWKSSPRAESATLRLILIECLHQLADVRQREGVYDRAIAYLEKGLQVLGETAPQRQPQLWRSLVERMAWIRFRQGELTEAFNLANSATAGLGRGNDAEPIVVAKLFNTLGGLAWQRGQLDEAVDYVERSLQLYEKLGYAWGQATAYGNLGILSDILGNWPRAIEYHQQAYALHETIGYLEGQARSLDNLGFLHMIKGDHQAAGQEMAASLSLRQRLGESFGIAQSRVNLAQLALIQSRFEQAKTYAEDALTLADTIGSSEVQIEARWILALVQAENDSLPLGLKTAKRALDMAQADGQTAKEIDCLRVLGVLQARAGESSEAEILLDQAIELSLAQSDPYRQAQALLELGRMYQSLAQTDHSAPDKWRAKALATLTEAAEQFEALGAAHDLDLAQAALNQIQNPT
jgi:tetratricopeptide (TPR) repeat protein